MARYTVFGGNGFIGGEFVKKLKLQGHYVKIPERNDDQIYDEYLGIVIYCSGTGDCANAPFDVLDANTTLLSKLLINGKCDLIVYLSSTRLYVNNDQTFESSNLKVTSMDNRKLFNLTKLVSEELCKKSKQKCLVIRSSNVYGLAMNSPLFLPQIIKNAIIDKKIDMYVSKNYSKDYISVSDLVDATLSLIFKTEETQVVNVASGKNTNFFEIANILKYKTNCNVVWHENKNEIEEFPITNISLLQDLVSFSPRNILDDLEDMIDEYYKSIEDANGVTL